MTNVSSNWDRVWQVIEMSGMTINAFAQHIGLMRSETLYQIKRGNNGISRNLAECIVAKYPEISKVWLLTGYGSMYADSNNSAVQIPFFNCDMLRITEIDEMTPISYICKNTDVLFAGAMRATWSEGVKMGRTTLSTDPASE